MLFLFCFCFVLFLLPEIYKAVFAALKEDAHLNVLNDSLSCAAVETKMNFENLLSSLNADLQRIVIYENDRRQAALVCTRCICKHVRNNFSASLNRRVKYKRVCFFLLPVKPTLK